MIIMHDGVEIFCLPDAAFCGAGNGRPIEDIDECPRGWKVCEPANCIYYSEEPIPEWIHFIIKDDENKARCLACPGCEMIIDVSSESIEESKRDFHFCPRCGRPRKLGDEKPGVCEEFPIWNRSEEEKNEEERS